MKAVIIGRHELLPGQLEQLKKLGVIETKYVASLPEDAVELQSVIEQWREQGVKAVIVQALPLRILARLWELCSRHGIDVVTAEMVTVGLARNEGEAKALVEARPDVRTYVRSPTDKVIRVIEFRRWLRVKMLRVELEELK